MIALVLAATLSLPSNAQSPIEVRVRLDVDGDSARLILTHSATVSYALTQDGDRLRIAWAEPVVVLPGSRRVDGPTLLRWEQVEPAVLELTLGPEFGRREEFRLRNPLRLVLDLIADPPGGEPAVPGDADTIPETHTIFGGRIVVIDPGHGGMETGATGPTGLREKDVTLDLARRLERRLESSAGVDVVLTREGDGYVGLDERTAIANHNRAELFLSIHLNSSPRKSAYGAETYYLATEATDDEARTLAALENRSHRAASTSGSSESSREALELVLWDLAQNRYLAESSTLAESVQKELNSLTGTRDRGVRQAPFRVLMGATMPAILVEVGFISNQDEEAKFRNLDYRDKVVEAIERAVNRFLESQDALTAP